MPSKSRFSGLIAEVIQKSDITPRSISDVVNEMKSKKNANIAITRQPASIYEPRQTAEPTIKEQVGKFLGHSSPRKTKVLDQRTSFSKETEKETKRLNASKIQSDKLRQNVSKVVQERLSDPKFAEAREERQAERKIKEALTAPLKKKAAAELASKTDQKEKEFSGPHGIMTGGKLKNTIMAKLHIANDGRVFDPHTEKELTRDDLVSMHKQFSEGTTKKSRLIARIDRLIKALPPGELKDVALPTEAKNEWVRDEEPHVDPADLTTKRIVREFIKRNVGNPEHADTLGHLNVPGGTEGSLMDETVKEVSHNIMRTRAPVSYANKNDPTKKFVARKLTNLSDGKPLYVGNGYKQVTKYKNTQFDAPGSGPTVKYKDWELDGGATEEHHKLLNELHADYTPENHVEAAIHLYNHGLGKLKNFTPDEIQNRIIKEDSPGSKEIQGRAADLRGENQREAKNILGHINAHELEAARKHKDPKLNQNGEPTRKQDLYDGPGTSEESKQARNKYWNKDDEQAHKLQSFVSLESADSDEQTPFGNFHPDVKNIKGLATDLKGKIGIAASSPSGRDALGTPAPTERVANHLNSRPKGSEKNEGETVTESPFIPYHSGSIIGAESVGPTVRHGKHLAHHDKNVGELQRKLKMARASVKVKPTKYGPKGRSPEYIGALESKLNETQSARDEMGKWGYLHSKKYKDTTGQIAKHLGMLVSNGAFNDPLHEAKATKLIDKVSKHWDDFETPTDDIAGHHEKIRGQLIDLHRISDMVKPGNVKTSHRDSANHLRRLTGMQGSSITPEFKTAPGAMTVSSGAKESKVDAAQYAHDAGTREFEAHDRKVRTPGAIFKPNTEGPSQDDLTAEFKDGYRKIDIDRGTQATNRASERGTLAHKLNAQEAQDAADSRNNPTIDEHQPVPYGSFNSLSDEEIVDAMNMPPEEVTPKGKKEFISGEEVKHEDNQRDTDIEESVTEARTAGQDEAVELDKERFKDLQRKQADNPTTKMTGQHTVDMAHAGVPRGRNGITPMEAHAEIAMAHDRAHKDTMKELEGSKLPEEQRNYFYNKTYGKHLGKHVRGIIQQQKLQASTDTTKKSFGWLLDMTDDFREKLFKSHIECVDRFNKSYNEFVKDSIKDNLRKALGVGGAGYEGAPGNLKGGNVLQAESLDRKPKEIKFPDGIEKRHCDVCDTDALHFGKICFNCAASKELSPKGVEIVNKQKTSIILRAFITSSLKKGFTDTAQIIQIFEEKIYPKLRKGAYDVAPVGHTSSGKPIYMSSDNPSFSARHEGFSAEDHQDAFNFYNRKISEHLPATGIESDDIVRHYTDNALRHEKLIKE